MFYFLFFLFFVFFPTKNNNIYLHQSTIHYIRLLTDYYCSSRLEERSRKKKEPKSKGLVEKERENYPYEIADKSIKEMVRFLMCFHWKEKYDDDDNYNTYAPDNNKPCYLTPTVLEDTMERARRNMQPNNIDE